MLLSVLAYHDARAGAPAAKVVPLARRAIAEGMLVTGEISSVPFVPACMVLAMADLDEAMAIYDDALARANRRGSVITVAVTKVFRAQTFVLRGDLQEAEAELREASTASETWGSGSRISVYLDAYLAEALMEQGKLDEATAALDATAFHDSMPDDARLLFVPSVRARLRMLS